MAIACTGRRTQQVKPDSVVGRGDQPEIGDGQRGRYGVIVYLFRISRCNNQTLRIANPIKPMRPEPNSQTAGGTGTAET